MTIVHVLKRTLHTTAFNCRGAVAQPGWYPRDHMPGRYPRNEEERRAAAIKYGMRPEDYEPYHPDDALNHMGDYPDPGVITYMHKDPYEDFTDSDYKRNWCEPVTRQFTRYRPDRWSYHGLDEEKFEIVSVLARITSMAVPIIILYMILSTKSELINNCMSYIQLKVKVGMMPKQYPYDFYRAFPYEDPLNYPVLNYSFEPADKCDPEGDNEKLPFNPTQRGQL